MYNKNLVRLSFIFLNVIFSICSGQSADQKKLKVFILAGQSNMVGAAKISTLGYIAEDPKTLAIYNDICDSSGKPKMVKDTWISYFQSNQPGDPSGEAFGQLTAGYGGKKEQGKPGDNIGPELTFGIYMQKALNEPVLIIKTAWGGKSLYLDFRPPSAGAYQLNESEITNIRKRGGDLEAEIEKRKQTSGVYYRLIMGHIRHVLSDIKRVYPGYEGQGYEIAGFVWFQGWNDMVNSGVYPQRGQEGGYDMYSDLMAKFIRDVRKDLDTPEMPFVIGVMGVSGPLENHEPRYRPIHGSFREAMAAPALLDEFKGNVAAVRTAQYWEMPLDRLIQKRDTYNQKVRQLKDKVKKGQITDQQMESEMEKIKDEALTPDEAAMLKRGASNAAYHYLGCGKTMALIGKAFADGLLELRN